MTKPTAVRSGSQRSTTTRFMRSRSLKMPRKLVAVKNEDGSDMELRHFPGYFGHGVMLFNSEELTLMYNVADTGHMHPPR